ncbi:MAG: penicillin acylase family protein [Anaerolineae bacterium]|jgi:penicillin amidase
MSKRLTILTATLGAAISAAAGALYYALLRRPLAQTSGTLHLAGLQGDVEIIRDRWGIPHIYADNPHDLFFAQGFVHAQDRLFQMDFARRLASGRLAEVVGSQAVSADRWLRVLGLRRVAEKEAALLDARTRELMLAYASGVNAYVDRGKLPLEFRLLRYRPERWQSADSLTWLKFMDWGLSVNWEAELLRAQLVARLGPERAAQLDAPYPQGNPTTLPPGVDWSHVGAGALKRADAARPLTGPPAEAGLGSNNWVVDGSRTASGAPLLANDMHLNLGMPSIWYENHLCGGYDVVGLSMPGVPSIVAGHNGRVAWGLTAGFPDTQDLYLERLNPDSDHPQYEFEGSWHDAEVFREEIAVKGAASVIEEVIVTRHGPLVDGLVPENASQPVALRWTALEPNDMAALLFDFCRARTCDEFHQELRRWGGPVLNIVYADVEGNIGYTLGGLMPVRIEGHDGRTPVPGWTGEYEWRGYVPFEAWPHAINPPQGQLITANAKPVDDDYPYFLGHSWLPGFRAARIAELLQDAQRLTVADFCRMQFDLTSVLARRVGQHLARLQHASPTVHYALTLFRDWDGDLSPGSPTAAIYQVFIRRMLYNLFDTLEKGGDLADEFVGKGPHPLLAANSAYGPNGRALLWRLLDEPDSSLFETHSLDDLTLQSLREAVEFLQWRLGPEVDDWRWGDLHQLTYAHPLGQVKPLDRLLNRGPRPIGGDETTVWATGAFYHSLDHERMVGPVCRLVFDLADLRQSQSLNAPGQSGQPGSRHYADRVRAWFEGDYHPMLYDRADVEREAEATLHLKMGQRMV